MDLVPGDGGCYAQGPYRTGAGRMEIGLQQDGCLYPKVNIFSHSVLSREEQLEQIQPFGSH